MNNGVQMPCRGAGVQGRRACRGAGSRGANYVTHSVCLNLRVALSTEHRERPESWNTMPEVGAQAGELGVGAVEMGAEGMGAVKAGAQAGEVRVGVQVDLDSEAGGETEREAGVGLVEELDLGSDVVAEMAEGCVRKETGGEKGGAGRVLVGKEAAVESREKAWVMRVGQGDAVMEVGL